jgi:hypothetical protein
MPKAISAVKINSNGMCLRYILGHFITLHHPPLAPLGLLLEKAHVATSAVLYINRMPAARYARR